MALARIQTALEDFPAAIAEYRRASEVRPDRVDLYTARASLEERLLRFDDAAATYAKLYDLNYHNSQWMEKVAEIRARQGRTDESVEALRRALALAPRSRRVTADGAIPVCKDPDGGFVSAASTTCERRTRAARHAAPSRSRSRWRSPASAISAGRPRPVA